ncbi:MAG: serine/threonine-protein kinase [Hyphomicrobium sp.]|jgi:serine/threonine protein kinase
MTNLIALQTGTELVGDYRIERVLGAGGFGITYLAGEVALGRKVTIKEYFPADFAARAAGIDAAPRSQDCASDYRWGLDRFIEEAQTLAKFTHPNIVRVYRYFRANNTGYMVLHFEEGQSLKAWLKSLGRAPRQKELDAIVAPLLDALETIHKADFLHRDIAPDNIIIRKDGTPVLIDFGSARGEIAAHSKTVSALVKPGYSPYEQYAETSRQQGPWTDIYALGSTLYHAVSGKRPPDSPSRMVKDDLVPAREAALAAYRPAFLKAIDHALTLPIEQRPQSIAAWRGALLAPEPAKPSWLSRTIPKRSSRDEMADALAAPAKVAAQAKAPPPATVLPPPPDAPGPKGGMLDFLDGLIKKPAQSEAVAPPAAAAAVQAPPPTEKIDPALAEIKLPRILKKAAPPKEPKKADPKEKRKAARPRPIRSGGSRSWRPLMLKLLIGIGVASAAVAMQDKFPQIENRGSGIISAATKGPAQAEAAVIRPLLELRGHTGPVTSVAFTSDGAAIATSGQDARLKIWNAGNGSLIRTIELDDGAATSLALSGTRALTSHSGGEVVLWDWQRAEKLGTFKRNEAEVWSVTFAGSGDRFAAASHDWKVALWDAATTSAPLQVIDAHDSAAQALAYSGTPDDGPLLATGGADKKIKLWNLDTFDRVRTYSGHKDFITALAFGPGGKMLASASLDGGIRVWSTSSSRLLRRLYGHSARVTGLAFSPDGSTIASTGSDGQLRIWDVSRGRTIRTIAGHAGGVNSVGFSPEGDRIVSAGDDGVARVWANPAPKTASN